MIDKINSSPGTTAKKFLAGFLYVAFLVSILPAAIYAFRKPQYNWDMLAYMALVIKTEQKNIDSIHHLTYETGRQEIPAAQYDLLVNASEYRKNMSVNSAAFYGQLPFYASKPLYILIVKWFYQAGLSLPKATIIPSIISYLLIGLLLFYWIRKYSRPIVAFVSAVLIMYAYFMISVAQLSSPDALSALLLLAAFYFILEKPSLLFLVIILVLAVSVRLDNLIGNIMILSFLTFSGKWQKKLTFRQYLVTLLIMAVCFFAVTRNIDFPGWNKLYYPTFFGYLNASHEFRADFSITQYAALLYSKAITGVLYSFFTIFLLLVVILSGKYFSVKWRTWPLEESLLILILLLIALRFFLFPDISDRFYIAYYLLVFIALIKRYAKG